MPVTLLANSCFMVDGEKLNGRVIMIPMSQLKIGNKFSNPLFRGYGKLSGIEWWITEINKDERMVKLQATSFESTNPIGAPIWKRNTDRIINESWRII